MADGTRVLAREIAMELAPLLRERQPAKRVFTTAEAAEYLGMSPEKVRQLAANGELRAVRIDSVLRFDRKDIDLLVETNKR